MKKYIGFLLVTALVPQIAFAAWWNPFTWSIFKRNKSQTSEVAHVTTSVATSTSTTTENIKDKHEGWLTYTSSKGYEVKYPKGVLLVSSDPTCVVLTKGFGYVYINVGSSDPCGSPTGLGITMEKSQDSPALNTAAAGWKEKDNSYSFYTFTVSPGIVVTYGVDHVDKSNSKSWKALGAFTEPQYAQELNSIKQIVETIRTK